MNVRVLSPVNASESRARSRVFPIVDAATDADLPVEALEFGGVECRLYQMRTSTVATRTLAQKLCYPYVLVTRDAHDRVSLSSFVFDEYRPEHPIDWKRRAWLMVPVIGTLLIVVIAVLQMRGPGLAHFIQALFREVSLTALWLITSASALQRYRTLAPSSPPADFASAEEFSSQVAAALLAQGWVEDDSTP